jgi:chromosome segregation ATPase
MTNTDDAKSIQEAARIYAQLMADIDRMRMELEDFEKEKAELAKAGDIAKLRAEVKTIQEEIKGAKKERDDVLIESTTRSKKISAEASAKVAEAAEAVKEVAKVKEDAKEALSKLDKAQREVEGSKAYVKDQLRELDSRTVSVQDRESAVEISEGALSKELDRLKSWANTLKSDEVSNDKASELLQAMEQKSKEAEKKNSAKVSELVSATKRNESSSVQMQKESKELQTFYRLAKEARGVLAAGDACDAVKKKVDAAFPQPVTVVEE